MTCAPELCHIRRVFPAGGGPTPTFLLATSAGRSNLSRFPRRKRIVSLGFRRRRRRLTGTTAAQHVRVPRVPFHAVAHQDRFSRLNKPKAHNTVSVCLPNGHELNTPSQTSFETKTRKTTRTWQFGSQSWFTNRNGPRIRRAPPGPSCRLLASITDSLGASSATSDDIDPHSSRIAVSTAIRRVATTPPESVSPSNDTFCSLVMLSARYSNMYRCKTLPTLATVNRKLQNTRTVA